MCGASASSINYYSSMLCIMHQYGSMLCIHGSKMCIRYQYGLMLCIRHQCGSIRLNAVHTSIWLNAVYPWLNEASVWFNAVDHAGIIMAQHSSMLCRHLSMVRCCASGIAIIIWLKPVHHVSIWLNAARFITLNLPHHTSSTSFLLLCLRLTLVTNKVEKSSKKPMKWDVM